MHKAIQKFQLIWIISSVIMLFTGVFIMAAGSLTGFKSLGMYLTSFAFLSVLIYIFFSAFQWFKFKKGEGIHNLITAYIILALLFTLGGLVAAIFSFPEAFYYFFGGLAMFAIYWLIVLVKNILKTEE
ncbi:MAG: hypothetical protein Q4G27_03045 [Flavobacteriaceae bacterium]|nr:hypothetical protein [Flavobacteriaceae bacterium]